MFMYRYVTQPEDDEADTNSVAAESALDRLACGLGMSYSHIHIIREAVCIVLNVVILTHIGIIREGVWVNILLDILASMDSLHSQILYNSVFAQKSKYFSTFMPVKRKLRE